MTDLRVRLLLEAEAQMARNALLQVQTDLQGVASTAREATSRAASEAAAFGAAYEQAGARATAAMQGTAVAQAGLMRSQQALASDGANVAAQINDIAVMWAAGQAPVMTAIQQGTQLTQILGTQGVAGAAGLARAAFATMFNPFSIGLIAALTLGGTFVQWLFDTADASKTVEDHLADVKTATDALAKANDTAGQSVDALTTKFGAQAEAMRELARLQAETEFRAAAGSAGSASRAIVDSFREQGVSVPLREIGDQQSLASLLGLSDWTGLGMLDEEVRRTVNSVGAALQDLDLASALEDPEQRLEAMTRAAEVLRQRFQQAAEQSGSISDEENAILQTIIAQQAALAQLRNERLETLRTQNLSPRMEGPGAGDLRTPVDVEANAELARASAELRAQAELQKVILLYGKDSVEAARARRDAERAVVEQMLAASNASEGMRQRYLAAWDAANLLSRSDMGAAMVRAAGVLTKALTGDLDGAAAAAREVAGADMSGNISAALGPAAALAARLWDAARGAAAAASTRVRAGATGANGPAFERGGRSGSSAGPDVPDMPTLDDLIERYGGAGGGGGGGGGSGISAEAREAASMLRKAAEEAAREIETARDALVGSLKQGFTAPFADFISGAARGKEAFDDFGNFIQQKMAEIAANEVWDGLFAPLFKGMGGGGVGDVLGSIFFPGGLFGGAFATGGAPLSSMANSVVGRPTPFRMGDGRIGVLGEEDDEAIMPLRGKGALAILPGMGEMRLPLARGAGGDLGIVLPPDLIAAVQPFARGGAPGRALAMLAAQVPGPRSAPSFAPSAEGGGFGGPRKVSVNVSNNGEPMRAEAEVTENGDEINIDVLLDVLDNGLARRVMGRKGALSGALQTVHGLGRTGR